MRACRSRSTTACAYFSTVIGVTKWSVVDCHLCWAWRCLGKATVCSGDGFHSFQTRAPQLAEASCHLCHVCCHFWGYIPSQEGLLLIPDLGLMQGAIMQVETSQSLLGGGGCWGGRGWTSKNLEKSTAWAEVGCSCGESAGRSWVVPMCLMLQTG